MQYDELVFSNSACDHFMLNHNNDHGFRLLAFDLRHISWVSLVHVKSGLVFELLYFMNEWAPSRTNDDYFAQILHMFILLVHDFKYFQRVCSYILTPEGRYYITIFSVGQGITYVGDLWSGVSAIIWVYL